MNGDPVCGIPPDLVIGPEAESLPMAGEVNWAMDVMGVSALRDRLENVPPIKIGIVDTGVDRNHPLLTNLAGAKDFTGSASGSHDRNGHGTHCTGTVGSIDPRIGVAAGFPLYHGKGLGDNGSGGNGLMRAIEWCLSEGCEIVSCSWGGGGQSVEWEKLFRGWSESPAKPWLIFAGGNSGGNTSNTDWPGRSQHLLNVAALDRSLQPASFSSAGDKIDTSGPGVDIWSTRTGGGFQSMSGTSMATPWVAGLHGVYRARLRNRGHVIPTVYELRELLESRSADTHTPGDDRRAGPGWVNPLLLSLSLVPDPPRIVR